MCFSPYCITFLTLCCMLFWQICEWKSATTLHWNELAQVICEGLHLAATGDTGFSKQSFHLWSFTPDFQGKPTKYLSNINLEQNLKTQLQAKTNELKWVSGFIEMYNLLPFPSNLCMSAGCKLPNSLLRAKCLFFFLFSTLLIPFYFIAGNYIYTCIYIFLHRVHVTDSYLIKIREIVLNFCLKTTFSISDLKKGLCAWKNVFFFPNTARQASKIFWLY